MLLMAMELTYRWVQKVAFQSPVHQQVTYQRTASWQLIRACLEGLHEPQRVQKPKSGVFLAKDKFTIQLISNQYLSYSKRGLVLSLFFKATQDMGRNKWRFLTKSIYRGGYLHRVEKGSLTQVKKKWTASKHTGTNKTNLVLPTMAQINSQRET